VGQAAEAFRTSIAWSQLFVLDAGANTNSLLAPLFCVPPQLFVFSELRLGSEWTVRCGKHVESTY